MLDAINRVLVHFSELTVIYSYYDPLWEPLPTGQFDGLWTGGFVNPELSNRRALQIADSLGADIAFLCKAKFPLAGGMENKFLDNEHLNTEIECNLVDVHRRAVYARKGVLGATREMTAELISEHLQLSVGSL